MLAFSDNGQNWTFDSKLKIQLILFLIRGQNQITGNITKLRWHQNCTDLIYTTYIKITKIYCTSLLKIKMDHMTRISVGVCIWMHVYWMNVMWWGPACLNAWMHDESWRACILRCIQKQGTEKRARKWTNACMRGLHACHAPTHPAAC